MQKNSFSEKLQEEIKNKLFTVDKSRKIDFKNQNIIPVFKYVYNIFQFVRNEKKLGTAVLIAIYQTMITRMLIRNEGDKIVNVTEAIDFAFVSNLIPQIWDTSFEFLETLHALCCTRNLGIFFRKKFIEIKEAQMMTFSKYAKQLEILVNLFKNSRNTENYFSTTDIGNVDSSIDSKMNIKQLEELVSNFKSGKKFDDEFTLTTFTDIIQPKQSWRKDIERKDLPMFESALNDEIRKSNIGEY